MSDERAKILSAYVELRDALQRFLLRRTGSRETAEDLTQETWLRLAGAATVPAIANPRAYIFRTAAKPTLLPGRVSDAILSRWDYREEESLTFTRQDRSSIYGGFHLYIFNG